MTARGRWGGCDRGRWSELSVTGVGGVSFL